MDWFRGVVQQRVKVKFKNRLERGKPGAARILNRIATVTEGGLEYGPETRGDLDEGHGRRRREQGSGDARNWNERRETE